LETESLGYEIKAEFLCMEKSLQLSFCISLLLAVLEVICLPFL